MGFCNKTMEKMLSNNKNVLKLKEMLRAIPTDVEKYPEAGVHSLKQYLDKDSAVFLHSVGVGASMSSCDIAGYLHDIGKSDKLQFTPYHSLNGAVYLERSNGFIVTTILVLMHSYSYELLRDSEYAEIYKLGNTLVGELRLEGLLRRLTEADMKINHLGETVTKVERYESIIRRYGESDPKIAKLFKRLLTKENKLHISA